MRRVAALLLLASCASPAPSVDEVRAAYNDSFCSHYKLTLGQAREILQAVFRWIEVRQEWEFTDERFFYADLGGGSAAGASMREHEDGIILSVTTRPGDAARVSREEVHRWFVKGVEIVKDGRALPFEPPVSKP